MLVIAGKDKGKTGKVLSAYPKEDRVVVEGVNIRTRHQRLRRSNQKGQIVEKTAPIHVSNVQLIDPKTKKPTRIGMRIENGKKVRVAKKSDTVIA